MRPKVTGTRSDVRSLVTALTLVDVDINISPPLSLNGNFRSPGERQLAPSPAQLSHSCALLK